MTALGDRLRQMASGGVRAQALSVKSKPAGVTLAIAPKPVKRNPFDWGLNPPVEATPELERILAVPRRPPPQITPEEAEEYTKTLRAPGGTRVLRPNQVAALIEAQRANGCLLAMGVGEGKTDVSALLPVVMGAKTAVLLVPPSLKAKFLEIEYPKLAKEYRLPHCENLGVVYPGATCRLHVVSYSQLSSAKTADILERIRPDLIICDEAQALKDPKAARTKRFLRYLRKYPATRLCVMSGSITTNSIRDFAHLLKYSLKENCPVPRDWMDLEAWAAVLDPVEKPSPPGELMRLCRPGESVRAGFQRRLVETCGVISTRENALLTKLVIHERKTEVPTDVLRALDVLRDDWMTPSGVVFDDALAKFRALTQVAAGLELKWIWPEVVPLEMRLEWLEARAEWSKEVREQLKGEGKEGMDSPLLLKTAHLEGRWKSRSFDRWSDIDASFRKCTGRNMPETVDVWINDWLVRDSVVFGKEAPAILWYEHADFGKALAEAGGFPFFGPGKSASSAIGLETGKRTIVASLDAHHKGHNLQGFSRMLFADTCPTNPTLWEQSMGRCHRSGQEAPVVSVYVRQHTQEMKQALKRAIEKARFNEETRGNPQKLLYCEFNFPRVTVGVERKQTRHVPNTVGFEGQDYPG